VITICAAILLLIL